MNYVIEEIDIFYNKYIPDAHRERHPFDKIPVLKHNDFLVYETAAITRYIDSLNPDVPLQPTDCLAAARMVQIISLLHAYAYQAMVWDVFVEKSRSAVDGLGVNGTVVAQGLKRSRLCLKALEQLQDNQVFLVGNRLTLADLHAYPMIQYLALSDEGADLVDQFPTLRVFTIH